MKELIKTEMIEELTGRYLCIYTEEKSVEFGLEVLRYNKIPGILGVEVHAVDNELKYLYEIKNYISLKELFHENIFTVLELKSLLKQLMKILNECGEYFLDEKNLVILCDCMFWDKQTKQLQLAYLDGYDREVSEGISSFLECFMDNMNHHDKELVFLVYGLHRISKENHFSLSKMEEFLQENERKHIEESQKIPEKPQIHGKEESPTYPEFSEPVKKTEPQKNYGQKILYMVLGVMPVIFAWKMGLLNQSVSGELDLKKVVILGILVVAVEGYLFRRENEKRKDLKMGPGDETEDKTTLLVGSYSDETVVLEMRGNLENYVNLIPEDWRRQEIKIRKSPFFIGKSEEQADGVIEESEVSRIHVKIVCDEEGVFLIDQESTNGTYLNGKRLIPWERKQIKTGDMIGISTVYYKVELMRPV